MNAIVLTALHKTLATDIHKIVTMEIDTHTKIVFVLLISLYLDIEISPIY